MAKNTQQNAEAPTADASPSPTPATTDAAAAAVASPDERYKMVPDPDNNGVLVKRKDFILRRFVQDKKSRGEIAKELTQLSGKKVPYQIVFAATKNVKGGPDKPAEGTTAAPATQAAS
jgi:hypothetical protein